MEGNRNKSNKRSSLFEQIRESILSTPGKGANADGPPPIKKVKVDVTAQEKNGVPTNSLLYSLWQEWDLAAKNKEAEEEAESSILEVRFEESDFDKVHMEPEEIENEERRILLSLLMKARARFQLTRPDEEGNIVAADAEVLLHVAKNRMAVWAFVFPPSGKGAPLKREQLDLALLEHSIVAGVDETALERMVKEQPYFKPVLVACGIPPVEGKNGYIVEKFARELEKTYAIDEHGKMDYHVQNNVQEIHAGDVICEAFPPVEGKDGLDVMGTVIPANKVNAARLAGGQNTQLSEDKTKLLAAMDGHLQYKGGRFHVEPTYYVRGNVDLHVGNINFHGDVHVTGDVYENFVIQSSGNVTVGGLVEGAVIEAGGDVIITNGILGNEKAVIKAGGTVQASFIESAIIYASGDVVAGSIIASEVYCDHVIKVRQGRGTIIGGTLVAGYQIDAAVIGSRAERLTTLVVGEFPYIKRQRDEILVALEQIMQENTDIEKTLNRLDKLDLDELTPQLTQKAADYRLRKSVLGMQINHLKKQLNELDQKQAELSGCKVTADAIYPITDIKLLEQSLVVRDKTLGYSNIHIEDGEVLMV